MSTLHVNECRVSADFIPVASIGPYPLHGDCRVFQASWRLQSNSWWLSCFLSPPPRAWRTPHICTVEHSGNLSLILNVRWFCMREDQMISLLINYAKHFSKYFSLFNLRVPDKHKVLLSNRVIKKSAWSRWDDGNCRINRHGMIKEWCLARRNIWYFFQKLVEEQSAFAELWNDTDI